MATLLLFSVQTNTNKAGIPKTAFEKKIDGKQVSLWTLTNTNGLEINVTNYGGKIVSLLVPDKDNNMVDIITGYNNLDDYLKSGEPYFGAAIGRYGNRIANGKFKLDGIEYTLAQNNESNNLHGGPKGFHAVVWEAKQINKSTLQLTYFSKDMEEGFPGNLKVKMIYQLTDENEFRIEYYAETDKKTICNLTNHTYFNLSGEGSDTILDHVLQINADTYLPTNETAIPYGKAEPVEDTPMDFRTPTAVGDRIEADFEALKFGKGYDHTYIINGIEKGIKPTATIYSPITGIKMEVLTDQPGVQLYSGNYMNGTETGKSGQKYVKRAGICLETQHYPDSPNQPTYPSVELNPEDKYESITIHKFSVK